MPYRGRRSYGPAFAAWAALGLAGRPWTAALALAGLERDASGDRLRVRRALARRAPAAPPVGPGGGDPLARRAGATTVGRVPAAGRAERTLVLVAHLDAARTGLVWHPRLLRAGAAHRRRTRTIPPALAPLAAGIVLAATPPRPARRLGRALCLLGVLGNLDVARPRVVPGANDNASGVAAVLALVAGLARDPLPATDVEIVLPGGEEAGMDGFGAWLRDRRPDPARTLVLGLDTLGCGEPVLLREEGAVRAHRYDPALLDRADAAARAAGLPAPERWRIPGWTDPVLALRAGIPALSLLSIGPDAHFTHYHHPSDRPEHVDHACVEACTRLAAAIASLAAVPERP